MVCVEWEKASEERELNGLQHLLRRSLSESNQLRLLWQKSIAYRVAYETSKSETAHAYHGEQGGYMYAGHILY